MKKQSLFLITIFTANVFAFANPPKTATTAKKTTTTKVATAAKVADDAIKFELSNETQDINVDQKDVLIAGNDNILTITGNVNKILITGKNNDITIVSFDEIVITGSGNFVSWEKTNNNAARPTMTDKGGYNNIGKKTGEAMNKDE